MPMPRTALPDDDEVQICSAPGEDRECVEIARRVLESSTLRILRENATLSAKDRCVATGRGPI